MSCNYYSGRCFFLIGKEDGCKDCPIKKAYNKGVRDTKNDYRPTSEWKYDSDNLPICKECGEIALQRIFVKVPHLIQDVRMILSNYCPNCGAKMKGEEE